MIASIVAVLCLLLFVVLPSPSLAYTFTPTPHPSAAHTRPHAARAGRHLTLPLSSHHSLTTVSPSSPSTFHPMSRFSTYQLATSNTTGCGNVDFSALLTIDGQGPFRLIVDTGSTTLAVVSSSCTSCDSIQPTYTPTSAPHQSVVSYYGGGTSWGGHSYSSLVSLGSSSPSSTTLIATIDSNSGFINSASCTLGQTSIANISQGIIGFAYPSIAVGGTDSWVTNHIAATSVAAEFTVQMCVTGGNLWVGDYDPTFLAAPFLYVPILRTNYYSVMLSALTVYTQTGSGSTPHVLSISQSVLGPCASTTTFDCAKVDSGTTQIILPPSAYQAVVAQITSDSFYQSVFSSSGVPAYDILTRGFCTQANAAGMPSLALLQAYLPKLGFTFSTAPTSGSPVGPIILTSIPGYITLSYDSTGTPYYCPGIEEGSSSSYPLLGFAFMNQFTVRHDLANQRLGFGKTAQCGVAAGALVSYEWAVGGWGGCSAACGLGVQWRQVNCTDVTGALVADIRCAVVYLSARPVDSRNCSVQACTASNTPTTFISLTITATSLTPGLTASIRYSYTGATPDYVSLYLSPTDSSSLPSYITANASAGSNSAGSFTWTVPSTTPTGTFYLAAYAGVGVTAGDAYISMTSVTISGCVVGTCGVDPCAGGCSGRGECEVVGGVGVCTCVGGYDGSACDVAPSNGVCSLRCLHGGVVHSSCVCSCATGYSGVLCEQKLLNVTLTLALNSSSSSSTSSTQLSTLASTVDTDVSYALGLSPSSMLVQSIQAVDPTTVHANFLLLTPSNASQLTLWLQSLTSQLASGPASPLGRGLATSTASAVAVQNSVVAAVASSSSSTAAPPVASPTAVASLSSTGASNATGGDPSDSAAGPSELMYIVIGAAVGVVGLAALVWLLKCCCCRRGGGQVGMVGKPGLAEGRTASSSASMDRGSGGGQQALHVVNVSPKGAAKPQKHGHRPSFAYGY